MAVTGIILVGYIVVHMVGNLLVFRGEQAMNDYAHMLQSNLPLVWGVRVVLLVAAIFHIHAAYTLSRLARAARPARYAGLKAQASTWSARGMRIGGVLLLVFIVFHILHLTTGDVLAAQFVRGDVYQNVVRSFSIVWVAAFYVVAMVALALHLHHGIWSVFQTVGANHPNLNPTRRKLAWLLSVVVPVGFAAVPLAIVFGMVR